LANLSLIQLFAGLNEGDPDEVGFQIIVTPSQAQYGRRSLMFGLPDVEMLCAELKAVIALLEAQSVVIARDGWKGSP
jgi:hypothetical protein